MRHVQGGCGVFIAEQIDMQPAWIWHEVSSREGWPSYLEERCQPVTVSSEERQRYTVEGCDASRLYAERARGGEGGHLLATSKGTMVFVLYQECPLALPVLISGTGLGSRK